MAFQPDKITKEHILKAVKQINKEDIDLIPSTKFDVIIEDKAYPPKEIMRYAHKAMNGEYIWNYSGGQPTHKYLKKLGFEIRLKENDTAVNKLKKIVANYKSIINTDKKNKEEIYKWQLVKKNQGLWHNKQKSIKEKIDVYTSNNLVYHQARAVILQLIDAYPDEIAEAFKNLFDEKNELEKRIKAFQNITKQLYDKSGHNNYNTHQDERTISTYLTFRYPEKYTFYKYSFYNKFIDIIGAKYINPPGNFINYMYFINEFIEEYIIPDKKLLELKQGFISNNKDTFNDKNHLILAQDVLFQTLEKRKDGTINNNDGTSLNQILYGPPGTGKTYCTINKALQIADPDFYKENKNKRDELKKRYNELVKDGQIVFTTFHQSMCYEDFIEGIKPYIEDSEVNYLMEKGIFKKLCDKAKEGEVKQENFEDTYKKFLKQIKDDEGAKVLETLVRSKEFTVYENTKGNLKFHANTEKAYEGVIRKEVLKHYLETGEALDWPSYVKAIGQYFIDNLGYHKQSESEQKNYVLIIDEINRGNIAQIFGELITLIEDDKRAGMSEALEVILPYSKEPFSVPPNLYLIGTMNTADRSVEALDTALRRRFTFKEMMPQPELVSPENLTVFFWKKYDDVDWKEERYRSTSKNLYDLLGIKITQKQEEKIYEEIPDSWDLDNINLSELFIKHGVKINDFAIKPNKLLEVINHRIEKLVDRDHTIGHSYFLKLLDDPSVKSLYNIFYNNIIPLLQEYFYNDYVKIGLILGNNFFDDNSKNNTAFKKFSKYSDDIDYEDYSKQILRLKQFDIDEEKDDFIEAVKTIYSNDENINE